MRYNYQFAVDVTPAQSKGAIIKELERLGYKANLYTGFDDILKPVQIIASIDNSILDTTYVSKVKTMTLSEVRKLEKLQ